MNGATGGIGRLAAMRRGSTAAMLPEEYSKFAWEWFRQNQEVVVLRVSKWFINIEVRVKQLRPLFVMLFGPEV